MGWWCTYICYYGYGYVEGMIMKELYLILFYLCAMCSASLWVHGNQGLSIWMGFCAIGNLVFSIRE